LPWANPFTGTKAHKSGARAGFFSFKGDTPSLLQGQNNHLRRRIIESVALARAWDSIDLATPQEAVSFYRLKSALHDQLQGSLATLGNTQFFHRIVDMKIHRAQGDRQLPGNLLRGLPVGNQ